MHVREEEIKMIMRQGTPKRQGIVRTPQFPGMQSGSKTIEEVRTWIKKQKRAKGYVHALGAASGANEFNLDISGSARIFLGFALLFTESGIAAQPDSFTMQINDEIVINQVQPTFFSPDFMDDEYYFFPRPLAGTDTVDVFYNNPGPAQTVFMIVYYV